MDLLNDHLYSINDAELSQYVYKCMLNATYEQKKRLSVRELRFFKNEQTMRKFADNENLDRRLLMLLRLGIHFALVCAPEEEDIGEALKHTVGQYQFAEKRRAVADMLREKRIFVTTSREYMLPMYFAAQNSHANMYVLDRSYQVLHERFGQLRGGKSIAALFRDNSDTVTYLSKYMLSELNAINSIESITGVNYDQLRVLLLLFAYRDTMVSMLTIMFSLHDGAKSTKVQKACKVLCDMGYIAREPGASKSGVTKKNYMILEEGMDVVLKYLDYVKTHGINELNRK